MRDEFDPDWYNLSNDETVIKLKNPSPWTLLSYTVLWGFVLANAIIVSYRLPLDNFDVRGVPLDMTIILIVLFLAVATTGFQEILRRKTWYLITNENVCYKRGLYQRSDVDPIRLKYIADSSFSQSYFQRFVGMGDVQVYTKGGTDDVDLVFSDVADPAGIRKLVIDEQKKAERREKEAQAQAHQRVQRDGTEFDDSSRPPAT